MTTPENKTTNAMPTGKKIRSMRGVIIDAVKETPDTWTLNIFVKDEDKDYKAGQFISISPHQFAELKEFIAHFEHHKGKRELVRAYSLTSAPHERFLAITIKPETFIPGPDAYPPLLSPMLASDILVGREIEFTGFAGAYVMPDASDGHIGHAIHLVAGSGVVPSYSVIKDELIGKKSAIRHSLVIVNRNLSDIIFHDELKKLALSYPDKLDLHYFLTKEPSLGSLGPGYYEGRPSLPFVEKLIKDKSRTIFFACGPAITKYQKREAALKNEEPKPRFMEWVHEVLERLEIDKKRIKREIYG